MPEVKVTCGESCEEDDDVTFTYTRLKRSTAKALLVKVDGEEVWLPFSHIVAHDEDEKTLRITGWLAAQKGLE
jgi:hypothetical protein